MFVLCVNTQRFKIIVIGAGEVGKTSFCRHLQRGKFQEEYRCTMVRDHFDLTVLTDVGTVMVTVMSFSEQERAGRLRVGAYGDKMADGVIVMFDFFMKSSWKLEVFKGILEDLLLAYGPDLSIAIMGNKIDDFTSIDDKEIAVKMHKKLTKHKHPLFTTSVKTGEDLLQSLKYLMQRIMGDENLELIHSFEYSK